MSLTSLTHASHAATYTFNGLLFATAGTIIPVLFLAIAVQGDAYDNLMKATVRVARHGRDPDVTPLRAIVLLILGVLILIYATLGEIFAMGALAKRQGGGAAPGFVLSAVIFLTLAAAAGPAIAFSRTYIEAASPGWPHRRSTSTGPPQDTVGTSDAQSP